MKIGVISLGCDKNRVDTEKMLARLVDAGYEISNNEDESDIIIINTCAFIDSAKSESIDEILNAISKNKKIIITGCLSKRYEKELKEEFDIVDCFLGVYDYDSIVEAVKNIMQNKKYYNTVGEDKFYPNRILTTPYHYAYLKISDGCDNHCTYCAIPSIRGKYKSETIKNLMQEAQKLSDDGVKELILVAQDVTRYGTDFDGKSHLIELIENLKTLDFEWIRLLYLYPEMVDDKLIEFIANDDKVVNYMDIPFQHIDSEVLKKMARHTTEEQTIELINKVKSKNIYVRSSFICGFPQADKCAYKKLEDFIKKGQIDFAGFFTYSREEGTPADKMSGHIDYEEKLERVLNLQKIQNQIIEQNNKKLIGKTLKVIYDGIDYDKQMFIGRAEFQAPDIDNLIYFTSDKKMEIGNFYDVEILDSEGIDLIGRV